MTHGLDLPHSVCFRVTRHCNARCGFCLAPPDGLNPAEDALIARLDWLLTRGVRTIHFCGGEPTIHPSLPRLLRYVRARGGKNWLTTNGIVLSDDLLDSVRATQCQVKVSVHGDRSQHNALVGRDAFDRTTHNLRRLLAAGVPVSVQTTLVAGSGDTPGWMAAFCLELGVRRLSFLPFLPRGSGLARRADYGLSPIERRALREQVAQQRRDLNGRLDVRWLDFSIRPIHVVEPDGRLTLEGATESADITLGYLPGPTLTGKP